jgi:hypothetical protein
MEINHYGDTILGAVATEDIVEGRLVLLTNHTESRNYGSLEDLPGAKLPDTTTEAAQARYIVTFEQDNRSTPIYVSNPTFDDALRYGFDQSENAPFTSLVYLTHPGVQEGRTVPSGSGCLLFGEGVYTVPSGSYLYSHEIEEPGCQLAAGDTVSDGAGSAGKLHYSTTTIVAEVVHYNHDNGRLTFKILH